jgi:hypothetical protein
MKKYPERPTPLVELPCEQDPAQVGLLIRSAKTAPGEDTPGVTWRIRDTLHRRTERKARVLRFALVGLIIFVSGGVVGAVVQPLLRTRSPASGPPALAPPTISAAGHSAHRRAPLAPSATEASTVPETRDQPTQGEVPTGSEALAPPLAPAATAPAVKSKPKLAPIRLAVREPSVEAETRPQPMPPVAPASAPVPLAAEQALISAALSKLRTTHEPAAALAVLDEYRARFPGGVLAPEATRLRTEAFLLLGRKAKVLDELDQTPSSEETADEDRLVLRGELRAGAGRWRAALADFDAVVRAHPANAASGPEAGDRRLRDRIERALWGRASARSHTGNDAGARADLREVLRRFPRGRFTVQAERLLDEDPQP